LLKPCDSAEFDFCGALAVSWRGAVLPNEPKPPLREGEGAAAGALGGGAGVLVRPPNEPKLRLGDEVVRLLLADEDFPEENPLLNELVFEGRATATSVTTGSIKASNSAILKDFIILEPLVKVEIRITGQMVPCTGKKRQDLP
jgi:hypothetical protein